MADVKTKMTVAPLPLDLVPYKGLVKATVLCCIGTQRQQGEVFEVDVPALWTDDPYEPVIVTGYLEDGITPVTEPNPAAPTPLSFRDRKAVSVAEDPTPRQASSY